MPAFDSVFMPSGLFQNFKLEETICQVFKHSLSLVYFLSFLFYFKDKYLLVYAKSLDPEQTPPDLGLHILHSSLYLGHGQ